MQHNKYVDHKDVIIYSATNWFTELKSQVLHNKPHGVRGLVKHYHMRFYPQLGHGTCATCCIPCDCTSCISILGQPWIPGLTAQQQPRYQLVNYFTFWIVLGSFNNRNNTKLS